MSEHSHAGSVMGTPSYMAPEQARGETDRIDERADVFALGSILCEILTGSPAFTGRNSTEILRKAAEGDTADALTRLAGCGAEAELIALAKDCLAVEPEDRPRDAKVVADRITAYLAGVQERVHAAERERAVAVARAIEERRRAQGPTCAGGLGAGPDDARRAEHDVLPPAAAGRSGGGDRPGGGPGGNAPRPGQGEPRGPRSLGGRAGRRRASGGRRRCERHAAFAGPPQEVQDGPGCRSARQDLLDRLVDIRSAEADDPDGSETDAAYAEAFREAGIDLASLPPAEAGAKIKARPPSVATALAAALDDWAAIRRSKRKDAARRRN